jgi:glycosyltransferase involved in cell wall biosynthesis
VPELVVLTEQLLAPVPGGTGRYTRELAGALAATAPPGWVVTGVVAKHADPSAAVIPGVAGPRVLPLPRRALAAAWARGVPLWPGGDAVHAPTPLAPSGHRRGCSLVVTVHDAVAWTHPETLTPRGAAWHRRVITRATHRADAVVVPSGAVAAELTQFAPGEARVHVVGEGVPTVLTDPPTEAATAAVVQRLRLPTEYVLAVGTVEPRKALDVLVAAMAAARAPDLPLVVAGPRGWGDVDLFQLAAQHRLRPDKLRVLGQISDAELAVVLRRAAVLAAPSLAEGFGLPLLEAMALGVPVVYSDAPALVELVGGTGLVFRRGDPAALAIALRTVLEDPRRTTARVEAGRARAARFTWERAARTVWKLHSELYLSARLGLR